MAIGGHILKEGDEMLVRASDDQVEISGYV